MKARIKLHLIIYIAIIAILTACENEIPYNPGQQEPQLIMNAMLDAGQTENYVYLHLSEGSTIGRISEATLSLYVNNQLAESPRAMTPEEVYSNLKGSWDQNSYESILKNIKFKKFRLTTALHPGDNIRLEAMAENGLYHVSAEVIVPHPVESLHVDTCLSYLRVYNGQALYRQFKITLHDRPNEKNYYRLEVLNDISYRCEYREYAKDENGNLIESENGYDWVYTMKDTLITEHQTEIINREDVILTDGHPTSYDDEENEMFPTIKNKYNIFTDNRFSNSSATLKVYTNPFDDFFTPDIYYNRIHRNHTITVRILRLSEAEYRYLRALNALSDDDYDEALMEPVSLPSNVTGGLGFVGIFSGTEYVMKLPEKIRPGY